MEELSLLLLGVLVGLVSSVLGLGGGVFMVPSLPLIIDMNQKQVIATSLAMVVIIVSINTWFFHRKQLVRWPVVLLIGPTAALAAFTSAQVTQQLEDSVLKIILACTLLAIAIRVIFKKTKFIDLAYQVEDYQKHIKGFVTIGLAAGVLVGLSGVGAGLIVSTALLYFHAVKPAEITPTTNGVMIFTALFASFSLGIFKFEFAPWKIGYINLKAVMLIALMAVPFAILGRRYQSYLPAKWRKRIVGSLLLVLSLKEFYIAFNL